MPTIVKIGEYTLKELYQPSGITDEKGGEITNLEAIRLIEGATGSQDVFISTNGQLSPEARDHNSQLSREEASGLRQVDGDSFMVAVISRRPPAENQ